jgi:hypothetical protein
VGVEDASMLTKSFGCCVTMKESTPLGGTQDNTRMGWTPKDCGEWFMWGEMKRLCWYERL